MLVCVLGIWVTCVCLWVCVSIVVCARAQRTEALSVVHRRVIYDTPSHYTLLRFHKIRKEIRISLASCVFKELDNHEWVFIFCAMCLRKVYTYLLKLKVSATLHTFLYCTDFIRKGNFRKFWKINILLSIDLLYTDPHGKWSELLVFSISLLFIDIFTT